MITKTKKNAIIEVCVVYDSSALSDEIDEKIAQDIQTMIIKHEILVSRNIQHIIDIYVN